MHGVAEAAIFGRFVSARVCLLCDLSYKSQRTKWRRSQVRNTPTEPVAEAAGVLEHPDEVGSE